MIKNNLCIFSTEEPFFFSNIFSLQFLKTRHGTHRQGGQIDPSLEIENVGFIFPILCLTDAHYCCPSSDLDLRVPRLWLIVFPHLGLFSLLAPKPLLSPGYKTSSLHHACPLSGWVFSLQYQEKTLTHPGPLFQCMSGRRAHCWRVTVYLPVIRKAREEEPKAGPWPTLGWRAAPPSGTDVHSKNLADSWLLSLSVTHHCYHTRLSKLLHFT